MGVIAAAFAAGTHVRSPQEEAVVNSQAHPVVTATVETRTVSTGAAVLTGNVSLGTTEEVPTPAGDAGRAVVTAAPLDVGSDVAPGDVVVEVSGRSILALDLPFPLYRDLTGGSDGPDVRALQEALADIGLYAGRVDGVYGHRTAAAVSAAFSAAGGQPPSAPAEALAAARAADDAVAAAKSALQATQASSGQPRAGADGSGSSDGAIADAAATLAAAREAAAVAHLAALPTIAAADVVDVDAGGAVLIDVAPVGTVLDPGAPVATLRDGSPTVTARVGVNDASTYEVGDSVTVTAETDGTVTATGTVVKVGDFVAAATAEGGLPGYDVVVALALDAPFADATTVRILPADGVDGVAGLAVPLVALREDSTGAFVLRVPGGRTADLADVEIEPERVPVTVGMSADGYVLVKPGELADGDVVVVATRP